MAPEAAQSDASGTAWVRIGERQAMVLKLVILVWTVLTPLAVTWASWATYEIINTSSTRWSIHDHSTYSDKVNSKFDQVNTQFSQVQSTYAESMRLVFEQMERKADKDKLPLPEVAAALASLSEWRQGISESVTQLRQDVARLFERMDGLRGRQAQNP